jgi:hypothetical protein
MLFTTKTPMPGIWKTFSTTNEPVSKSANKGPEYETTGQTADRSGLPTPGPKDPKTGFGINESGQYTVFPDCTGQSVLNLNPIVKIEVKFVLVDEGRQTYGIESRHSVVPVGTSFGGIVCDLPAGCAILPHLHADNTKLK